MKYFNQLKIRIKKIIANSIYNFLKIEKTESISTMHYTPKFEYVRFYNISEPYWFKFKNIKIENHKIEKLSNAKIIGNGAIIDSRGFVKLESTIFQKEYLNQLHVNHKILLNKFIYSKRVDQVISLSHPGIPNYYHWTIETLTRLLLVNEEDMNTSHVIINKNAPEFVIDSLKILYNIKKEQLIYSSQKTVYKSSKVILTPFTHERNKDTNWTNVSNPDMLKILRNKTLEKTVETRSEFPSNIIISRKKANERRIINEDELIKQLEPFQFKQIFCEDLTFEQQVNLFRNVKIVIATHGAALSNMLFAPEGTKLIELFPKNRNIRDGMCFAQISSILNHKHYILAFEHINNKQDFFATRNDIQFIINFISK
jgi:hypothetical protein